MTGEWKKQESRIKQPTNDGIFGKFLNLSKIEISHLLNEDNNISLTNLLGAGRSRERTQST